ncbi:MULTISPECIES: hypothetical protein [Limnospira]|uniref:DUF1795 domain-containing protein n=1 Tax=Limnospira fusiformis PMC 851.14 TaxID=2219512 RepID=A0ABU9EUB9_LIMFS|nr:MULTISPECIES: hypothetical protein [unclassified Limnospira]MDY7051584.1 hypothetical protein [Limnospira fusiformis LS22]QJB28412.1 hypothetical protein HFV01_24715 [Limnospira fusiformis SAG 85.79]MDT9190169.1 hypothetical protein [Limnospira sp. PMC 894.15]MDT9236103.1 hypothetical protein [Limnospira sp. PMC 917.15]MDT9277112.1 hypothetical protein [Limnospira sp. PMC 737.11]
MFYKIFTSTFIGLSLSLLSLPVVANECSPRQIQPASETRQIVNQEYRLRFEIPINYQASLNRHDHHLIIEIKNPGDVAFEACIDEHGRSGNSRYVATNVFILISDLPGNMVDSDDLLTYVNSRANHNNEQTVLERITIHNQEVIIVSEKFGGNRSRFPETNRYAYILHPNGQHLIRIRAWQLGTGDVDAVDLEIQKLILSTLSFF